MPNDEQAKRRTRARIPQLGVRAADLAGRYASCAFRWLVAGVFLVAAVIGFLFITRGTAVRRVRGIGGDGTPADGGGLLRRSASGQRGRARNVPSPAVDPARGGVGRKSDRAPPVNCTDIGARGASDIGRAPAH